MEDHVPAAAGFHRLVAQNSQAQAFYQSCTQTQRRAIHAQLHQVRDTAQLRGFVDHLPAAAL